MLEVHLLEIKHLYGVKIDFNIMKQMLTSAQINVLPCPKANTVIFDTTLNYDVIYDGIMWVKFIKPRVRWFVKSNDSRQPELPLRYWASDKSIVPKDKSIIAKDDCYHIFYNLRYENNSI